MRNILTINKADRVMLTHDEPLHFDPAWVEVSPEFGIRVISEEGEEHRMCLFHDVALLDRAREILLVQAEGNVAVKGYMLPLVVQPRDQGYAQ